MSTCTDEVLFRAFGKAAKPVKNANTKETWFDVHTDPLRLVVCRPFDFLCLLVRPRCGLSALRERKTRSQQCDASLVEVGMAWFT